MKIIILASNEFINYSDCHGNYLPFGKYHNILPAKIGIVSEIISSFFDDYKCRIGDWSLYGGP